MDGSPQTNDPVQMTFTVLLIAAVARLHRIISEKKSVSGFGFRPDNEEIIDYVKKKRLDPRFSMHMIKEIDVYSCEPWDLPWDSGMQAKEPLYIFSEPFYKKGKSKGANRRTNEGNWKVTGQGSKIMAENSSDVIGNKRILPFFHGGSKTDWVMHEFYVSDDPRYQKDFVLCRVERKRNNKHGISKNDEGQSNQQMVPYSGNHVTENTILEAVEQPSNSLISNRNYVTENIFSKTRLLSSDHVISNSRNQNEEYTLLDSQQQSSDHLISSSRNHVAENACEESQVLPNYNMVPYSRNHVAEKAYAESQLLPNYNMIPYSGNHVAENGTLESQLLPNHNVIPYSGNHVAENGSPELQLLPNYNLIPYSGNHVAENGSPELQLPSNHNIIYCSRNYVAENACEESQQLLHHNLISYSRNHVAENTSLDSQPLVNHNMISRNMISCSGNHIAENSSPELQSANHNVISRNMISCSGNHIVENDSPESQQLLTNLNLDLYSLNNILEKFSDEHLLFAEFNACSGYNGLNNAPYSAQQSPICSEQGSSYSTCSNNGGDLLNSQFGSELVDYPINSERAFQNGYSCEETGQIPIPHCYSSKPDEGVYGEDSCDMDNDAWVNELSKLLD